MVRIEGSIDVACDDIVHIIFTLLVRVVTLRVILIDLGDTLVIL